MHRVGVNKVNIFNFKNSILNTKQGKSSKIYTKEKSAFTYIEMVIVMILISIVFVVSIRVVNHNIAKKIPLYVYNLYNELESYSYMLTNKLQEENDNTKKIEDILNSLNSQEYCNEFAQDLNTISSNKCEFNSNISSGTTPKETINCTRDYSLDFDMDANIIEKFTPQYVSTLPDCMQIKENSVCQYNPKTRIDILAINNTASPYAYSCVKTTSGNSNHINNIEFPKPSSGFSIIKLSNNINLSFLDINKAESTFNFNVKASQVTLNRAFGPLAFNNCKSSNTDYSCKIEGNITGVSTEKLNLLFYKNSNNKIQKEVKLPVSWNVMDLEAASAIANKSNKLIFNNPEAALAIEDAKLCGLNKNCQKENYTRTYSETDKKIIETYKLHYDDYGITVDFERSYSATGSQPFFPAFKFYENISKINDMFKTFTYHYNNSVKDYGFYILENKPFYSYINQENYNEDTINNYKRTHIIYASIDIPFSEGEMNKNIFMFEQFGNKIIPIGYLANSLNTPLKFDVITRHPQTHKIKKINEEPLTYCEAMKYTGEEFSEYCGCKENNQVVTKYMTPNSQCKNIFGCKIKAVKPSTVGGRL